MIAIECVNDGHPTGITLLQGVAASDPAVAAELKTTLAGLLCLGVLFGLLETETGKPIGTTSQQTVRQ
jgi:hypothetical protein